MIDLLLRGARVVDGSGASAFSADVAIAGERITAVEGLGRVRARRTIELDGLVLAPGFIDLHTHADFTLPVYPRAPAYVRQGVTTLVVGNCGFSPFPVAEPNADLLRSLVAFFDGGLAWTWTSAGEYLNHLERLPLAVNVAALVGHGALRTAVCGDAQREATRDEFARMSTLLTEALDAGAFGLSAGLAYPPGSHTPTAELRSLGVIVGRAGGFVALHLRDEGEHLLGALEEALDIRRRGAVAVHVSHHKALGRRNWGSVHRSLARIDQERSKGADVTLDCYPYTASSTTLTSLLPRREPFLDMATHPERLREPRLRQRVAAKLRAVGWIDDLDPSSVRPASVPPGRWTGQVGKSLAEIAGGDGAELTDLVLELIADVGNAGTIVRFAMAEADVDVVLRHSATSVASDGWTLHPNAGGLPHPRSYGTFARILGRYVRERGLLTLEEAVRKMTSLPASRLGLRDRGVIRTGHFADLVAFDPERVSDEATFEDPHRFAVGVELVVVNGQVALDAGGDPGVASGRALRRRPGGPVAARD